jgi:hypothetical protein
MPTMGATVVRMPLAAQETVGDAPERGKGHAADGSAGTVASATAGCPGPERSQGLAASACAAALTLRRGSRQ